MAAAIYFPLFLVLVRGKQYSVFYLSADLQTPNDVQTAQTTFSDCETCGLARVRL